MEIGKAAELIIEKLEIWAREIIAMLPNLVLAVLILTLAFFVAKYARKLAYNFISKVSHKEVLNSLFATFIYFIVVGIGLFTALSVLELDKAVTSLLTGAGIIGLALGFASQDIVANFISGIFITFRRPFNVGDLIKTNDYLGRVKSVTLRDTVITTLQGHEVIIPNKQVFQSPIENMTSSGRRRMDLDVGISYGDDLEKVKKVVLEATSQISTRSEADEITFSTRNLATVLLILRFGFG